MVIILMGVSGCGKTTVGRLLAADLNLPFFDADDFHSLDNIKKMKCGISLNDKDRQPWLESLSTNIREWERSGGAILACSALKKSYRTILNSGDAHVVFVYLKGSKNLILERIYKRKAHYMPAALLDSQFAALEEPGKGLAVSIEATPEEISNQIKNKLKS